MALSKLAVKRLTKLADYMEKLPASANKHFNMESFFFHNGEHEHKWTGTGKDLTRCGTTACAAGWAATMPYFRDLGLRLTPGGYDSDLKIGRTEVGIDNPKFLGLFGIATYAQSESLFGCDLRETIKTPKQWAKHCRKFIRDNS